MKDVWKRMPNSLLAVPTSLGSRSRRIKLCAHQSFYGLQLESRFPASVFRTHAKSQLPEQSYRATIA